MSGFVLTAMLTLSGLMLISFVLGVVLGRFGERDRIASWLWDLPSSPTRAPWTLAERIEHGDHRRRPR